MKRVELSLENMSQLHGGKMSAQFKMLMKRVIADLTDRPTIKKARKIEMEISITPADINDLDCDHVDVEFHLSTKIPGFSSRPYTMKTHKNDVLSFHPDFIDEPDRDGLYDDQDPNDQKGGKK